MGVLRAVLADPRQVALDVPGVERRYVERRGEEHEESGVLADQVLFQRAHREPLTLRLAGAGDDAPALGDRIDATLLTGCGAERRPVIEVRSAIPGAVPRVRLDGGSVRVGPLTEPCGGAGVPPPLGVNREESERPNEEPGQPHALALSAHADAIHPVVPVTDADQRKPVIARGARLIERADTVRVHGGPFLRHARQVVDLVLVRIQLSHGQEGRRLVEHRAIACDAHVVIDDIRQPREVVGESSPHSAAALRMPPVLDVALGELPPGRADYVLARDRRLRVDECHHVLQLVAEAVGAATLIQRRPCPHPTGECLVERPPVEHHVE